MIYSFKYESGMLRIVHIFIKWVFNITIYKLPLNSGYIISTWHRYYLIRIIIIIQIKYKCILNMINNYYM